MTREEKLRKVLDKVLWTHNASDDNKNILVEAIIEVLEQEPCEDAVSRQAVIDMTGLSEWFDSSDSYNEFVIALSELPSVTPQNPRKGHWVKEESPFGWDGHSYQCSECGRSIHLDTMVEDLTDYSYCHCGAYMREVQEDDR